MNNLIEIKQYLTGKVADAFKSLGYDTEGVSVAVSNRPEMADYQCNSVFILAKKTGKNPLALAEEVLPALQKNLNGIAEVSVAGAFVNLKLTQSGLSKIFEALYKAPTTEPKNGKTVVLDYGGANVAKELHMGHLRSPIIGEAIKNLYTKFGYTTIADAHLGDWGLQMGLVMAMLEEKGLVNFSSANAKLPNITLALLNECYPEASKRSKIDAEFKAKAEFADDYFEHEEEYEANIFAGMLLMPESSFRQMYRVFRAQSDNNEMDTLIRLMNYYQVPYMAALVRCYELGLTESGMLTQQLIELDKASIREKIESLWLDSSILDASNKDHYIAVERVVKRMGTEYLQEGYLNERTLRMVLQNMNSLYREIKGEHK